MPKVISEAEPGHYDRLSDDNRDEMPHHREGTLVMHRVSGEGPGERFDVVHHVGPHQSVLGKDLGGHEAQVLMLKHARKSG